MVEISERPVSFEDTAVAFQAKTDKELRFTYLIFGSINRPWLVKPGTWLVKTALAMGLPIKGIIKNSLFRYFCGGESIEDCETSIQKLGESGIGTILDYSVEGEKNEASFDATMHETIRTLEYASGRNDMPFGVFKVTGLAATPLLTKVQEGSPLSAEEQGAWERATERVARICAAAEKHDVPVFVDGEESWIQNPIDDLAYAMMAKYNTNGRCLVYNTFQMYRHDMLERLRSAHKKAVAGGYELGAKLVRGAYMEKERERAKEKGYESPIQPDKASADRDFDAGLKFCLDNKARVYLVAGTHNEASSQLLALLMGKHGLQPNDPTVWFAQLYGMSDHISFNLAKAGYNVAKYVPYGPVKAVMPYLFRRASENTSVKGQASREFSLVSAEYKRRKAKK